MVIAEFLLVSTTYSYSIEENAVLRSGGSTTVPTVQWVMYVHLHQSPVVSATTTLVHNIKSSRKLISSYYSSVFSMSYLAVLLYKKENRIKKRSEKKNDNFN